MRAKAGSLLLMWLVGCSPVTLDDMEAPTLFVTASPSLQDLLIFLDEDGDDCPELSSQTRAHFNKVEVPLREAGGHRDSKFMGPGAHCAPTIFHTEGAELPPPLEGDVTRVVLTEGTTMLFAEAQSLCSRRTFRVVSPADGVLRPDTEVELEWQPATDTLLIDVITVSTPMFGGEVARLRDGTLQVEGNRFRFRMPPLSQPVDGPGKLVIHNFSNPEGGGLYRLYRPQVTRCEGFVRCDFECLYLDVQWDVPVTVQSH